MEEGDVRGINEWVIKEEEEAEQEHLRQMGEIEGEIKVAGMVAAGEGTHTMSWTGMRPRSMCKAYARLRYWNKDIVIVNGKIKQTIKFSDGENNQYDAHIGGGIAYVCPGARGAGTADMPWADSAVGQTMGEDVEAEEFDPEDEEGMWRGTSLSRTKAPTARTMMFDVQCKLR
ncbi:hypothetical protein B0H13DRAFT_1913437 [Mycena leptocephala]|nr:hypothetical protein B0H13DRAFT_1913437 [Mycena leptocephala]